MSDKYILKNKKPIPCKDLSKWAKWFEKADRKVEKTEKDGIDVSTVFLGIDHRFGGEGGPLLFETMVFGGDNDGDTARYSTWKEAKAGHKTMCEKVY